MNGDAARILRRELTEILRDPRALIAGLVLPLLLYPALIFGMQAAQKKARETLEEMPFLVAILEEPTYFADVATHLGRGKVVTRTAPFRALREGAVAAVVDDRRPGILTIYFDASSEASGAAMEKVRTTVVELQKLLRQRSIARGNIVRDPRELVTVLTTDLTEGQSATQLPLYAPFILILGVMGGGSMAALDAVAGERERGTIETLLVQPVSRGAIAIGKLGAVVVMALLSTIANIVAVALTALFVPQGALAGLDLRAAALLFVLSVPLAVLLSAVLLAVTSYARSYREAQGYHYPVMLLALLPAVLPAMPGVKLDAVLAWVPVGNVALAISEILRGVGHPGAHLLALATTSAYALAALALAVRLLGSEEVLSGSRHVEDAEIALARKAVAFSLLLMLLTYYAGTWMQSRSLLPGLLATLWGIIFLPAVGFALGQRIPVAVAFPLPRPAVSTLVGAVLAAVALPAPVLLCFRVQSFFLPAPEGLEKGFAKLLEMPPWVQVFALGVSPGVCEEVLFRGLLFTLFLRGRGPWRALLWSSLLFGAFHLSAHRLLPTALAGLALGAVRWRTGSLWPCFLLHAAYNTLLGFHADVFEECSRAPWGVPLSLVVLGFAFTLLRPATGERSPPPS